MRIQENNIQGKKVIHIYIKTQEQENSDIHKKIKQIKLENKNVVVFFSGNQGPKKVLKTMVTLKKNEIA